MSVNQERQFFDDDGNLYDEIIWEDQSDFWAVDDDDELEFWLTLSEDTSIRFLAKENEL